MMRSEGAFHCGPCHCEHSGNRTIQYGLIGYETGGRCSTLGAIRRGVFLPEHIPLDAAGLSW